LEVLKRQVLQVINAPEYQKGIAAIALVLGGFAVCQGFFFYQMMVFAVAFVFSYIIVLSQANLAWSGSHAIAMKHVAALLVASFVVCAAYQGWEGVQIFIGGAFGLYIYSQLHGLAFILLPEGGKVLAEDPITVVVACALSVLLGMWMLHEKYGAGRVLGVLCPALGGTFLVSSFGYILMYALAHTKKNVPENVPVTPSEVPSVFQFWSMIVDPTHAKSVGYFEVEGDSEVSEDGYHFHTDKFLCILLSVLIFFVAAKFQLKNDAKSRKVAKDRGLTEALMATKIEEALHKARGQ